MENAALGAAKKARRQRAWFVFEDESGIPQQPVVRRTWAPPRRAAGPDPYGAGLERLSVAGALAFRWDGCRTRFFFQTREGNYTDIALIAFLRGLRCHFPRQRVLLIWDGLRGLTSRVMSAYLAGQRG